MGDGSLASKYEGAAPAEATKKNRFLKWLLLGTGFIVSAIVILLLVIYFTLRSGSLTQSAVPELRPYLEPFGIQLNKVGLLRFDLLKSLELKDLDLSWHDSDVGMIDLSIGKFNFNYSLAGLFDQRVEITQLLLQDVKITAHMLQSEAVSVTEEDEAELDFTAIEEMLKNPPVLLNAQGIAIKNIQWDVSLEQPEGLLQYQGELTSAQLALAWTPDKLNGFFELSLGQGMGTNQLKIQSKLDHNHIELTAKPSISMASKWRLENSNGHWLLDNTVLNLETRLENIKIVQSETQEMFSLKLLDLTLNNDIASSVKSGTQKGLKNLFPIRLDSQISSNALDINISNFKQADLSVTGQGSHHLSMTINGDINPFSQHLPQLKFNLTESLNLNGLDVQTAVQHIKAKSLSWALSSTGETVTDRKGNTSLDAILNADAKISQLSLDQPAITQNEPGIKLKLDPEIRLETEVKLASFDEPLEHLVAQLKPDIIINNLFAKLITAEETKEYKLPHSKISMTANYAEKKIKLETDIRLDDINAPEVKKTFSVITQAAINTDLDVLQTNIDAAIQLDHYPLMNLSLNIDNDKNTLRLQHDLKMQLSPELSDYHDAAAALEEVGEPHLSLTGNTRLRHNANDIQSANFELFDQWLLETSGRLNVIQHQAPTVKTGIVLSGPLNLNYSVDNAENYQVDIELSIPGVHTPPLEQAIPIKLVSKNNLTWPLTITRSISELDIAGKRAVSIDLTVQDKKEFFDLVGNISLDIEPAWKIYLKDLEMLETAGAINARLHVDAKIQHPFLSMMNFEPGSVDKMVATVLLNANLSQDQSTPGSLLVLSETATINQKLNWSSGQLNWQSQLVFPDLLLPNIVALSDIDANIELRANLGLKPDNAELTIQLSKGGISLLSEEADVAAMQLGHVVTPLNLISSASWTEKNVNLKQLSLNLGEDLFTLQASGTASLDGKNAEIESKITSRLRENLLDEPSVSGTGDIQIPVRLTLLDGKQVALEGEITFDAVNLRIDDLAIQNFNGSIVLEEELLLDNGRATFRYLLDPNPFQRVDFSRIQPYLNTSTISIDKISTAELSVGPLLASVMLKQNVISLQQFDIDLFSGHSAGRFYLDVRPGAWKLGLLSRITHLDPRQLLDKNSKLKNSKLSPINSRVAIEFDIHKRLMEGEIVVSQINRDQLLQLLDVVDPAHEDEQMAQLRKGLRFSHPELIEVKMQRGLMNLKVKLAGLAKVITVTGLPLTSMIQQYATDLFAAIDQIPLE